MSKYVDCIRKGGDEYPIEGSVRCSDTPSNSDLAVSDPSGNVIMSIKDGNIKTKSFDSSYLSKNGSINSDLDLQDEGGNVIARFANGNLETKNTKNYKQDILMEGGTIDQHGVDAYSYSSYRLARRTAFFINTNGAKEFIFGSDIYLFKYNSSHEFQSMELYSAGNRIPINDCAYFRFIIPNDSSGVNSRVPCWFNGSACPFEEKKVAMHTPSERLLFHVDGEMFSAALLMLPPNYTTNGKKVPLIVWDSGDGSYKNWNAYEMGTGYERRRIGLEYMRDQGFAVLEIYSWGSYYYEKYDGCGNRSAMPIPTHLKTHEKGVEYVCDRYNVDINNVFHLSKSGSGKLALYYALKKPAFGLKSIYAFAPVFDDLNFGRWGMPDYRKALFEELNLEGTEEQVEQFRNGYSGDTSHGWLLTRGPYSGTIDETTLSHLHEINQDFVRKNMSKFTMVSVNWMNIVGQSPDEKFQDTLNWGYKFWETDKPNWSAHESPDEQGNYPVYNRNTDVYNRHDLTMIGNHIPIKVIMAKNDEQTPYWSCLEVINQLRNGGTDATIYPLSTGGHSAPDMGTVEQATNITTLCGQTYDAVSVGWYIACADIQKRYLAHIDKDVYDYING